MFTLIVLCALSATLIDARETIPVPSHIIGSITEKSVECIGETGADLNILQRVFQWKFDNNKTSKKFSFCLFKKAEFSDDKGHFDINKLMVLYKKSDKKAEIEKVARECDKIQGKIPEETMYKIIQCFFKKTPVLLEVKLD